MSTKSWTVTVDGQKQTITVDVDAQTRRAMIRVNGRVVAKPMSAGDSERQISVGSVAYVVRRDEKDNFDLDIPPEVFLNRMTAEKKANAKSGSVVGWAIGAIVLVVVVAGLLRFGRRGLDYMKVPWQPYASSDGSFTAKFPNAPSENVEEKNINGDIWSIKSLLSEYKGHAYAVQYIDMKTVVTDQSSDTVMDRFFQGWTSAMSGHVESKEKTSLARNHAFNFVVVVPPQADIKVSARLRGVFALRGNRLFIVWAGAAQGDPFSKDLSEFLDAFHVAPASERPAELSRSVEASLSGDASVPIAPPPPAPKSEAAQKAEEIEQKQRDAETEARRAAEPQIYLEPQWKMFHVAGCKDVTPQMQRVAIEQRPFGYVPHTCVPDAVRNWKRTR